MQYAYPHLKNSKNAIFVLKPDNYKLACIHIHTTLYDKDKTKIVANAR